ncbi:CapA family protein [Kitasatospora atroaurantiaca]|uniref:Poly-gamma-glutamate synthesis protein (Capsule biosynthesis protein) n=1 Tax=Kitasatospora atroaurantiaca TaxID=285545 RepID=A0A561EKW3_9ACTN|nr:CapA family protein [Kitasatospora atroaurantiaca]TWE16260.1 poly-gamma-glutamate synthesis protein (capsule biosynthesis protein) [Kitasatospora atroaurantiaca]
MSTGPVSLFLCGDVMLGRGIDQILPHPGDPTLREPYVRDARYYVESAETANGPIPCPVDFSWPWGEALRLLDEAAPEVRVLNLETSVTRSDDFAPGKEVHYRMTPANLPCLEAARPDVCVLANNHVLDFGHLGLEETLGVLASAGLQTVGAGRDAGTARQPAIVPVDGGRRVVVFAFGTASSGIPSTWAAAEDRAGVYVVSEASDADAAEIVDRVEQVKQPGDVVVASIHWGSNWGYSVSRAQIRFAHALIDRGVDVVYGHSSHHPRPVEVYRGRLVLYGCGDFIDDYEGISGYEQYRDDLRLLYFISVEPDTGELISARMVPVQARKMRLEHASHGDSQWEQEVLDRVSRSFGTRIDLGSDGVPTLRRT